jgi:hypothetical protein
MLGIVSARRGSRFYDGLTRRDFLRVGVRRDVRADRVFRDRTPGGVVDLLLDVPPQDLLAILNQRAPITRDYEPEA